MKTRNIQIVNLMALFSLGIAGSPATALAQTYFANAAKSSGVMPSPPDSENTILLRFETFPINMRSAESPLEVRDTNFIYVKADVEAQDANGRHNLDFIARVNSLVAAGMNPPDAAPGLHSSIAGNSQTTSTSKVFSGFQDNGFCATDARCDGRGEERARRSIRKTLSGISITPPTVNAAGEIDETQNELRFKVRNVRVLQGPILSKAEALAEFVTRSKLKAVSQNGNAIVRRATDKGIVLHFRLAGNERIGSYWSPLMVFFDEQRPTFESQSRFALKPQTKIVSWHGKNPSGYWLALDNNHNGKIDDGSELFGDDNYRSNGISKLMDYDSNFDGVIDSKDVVFSKLLLWKDSNANGVSEKNELMPMTKMGISSIQASVQGEKNLPYGKGAISKEFTSFVYSTQDGKIHRGKIEDIWLKPIEEYPQLASPLKSIKELALSW